MFNGITRSNISNFLSSNSNKIYIGVALTACAACIATIFIKARPTAPEAVITAPPLEDTSSAAEPQTNDLDLKVAAFKKARSACQKEKAKQEKTQLEIQNLLQRNAQLTSSIKTKQQEHQVLMEPLYHGAFDPTSLRKGSALEASIQELTNEQSKVKKELKKYPQHLIERAKATLDEPAKAAEKAHKIALQKLQKNARKALEEHAQEAPDAPIASAEDLRTFAATHPQRPGPLSIRTDFADLQGRRPTMEDAHLIKETKEGSLFAVFDGHGGSDVARFAAKRVDQLFFPLLKKHNSNVRAAFTELFDIIESEIKSHPKWDSQGSTAVVSFVDPKTKKIFTATIGDSEATIYRQFSENQTKAIPLSCIRNWTSEKDKARLLDIQPERAPLNGDPKHIRWPAPWYGVNVSRALGDEELKKAPSALIHKPKITVQDLYPNDTIVIACDGLKDYTSEKEVISVLNRFPDDRAKRLVQFAFSQKRSTDNITAMVLSVR